MIVENYFIKAVIRKGPLQKKKTSIVVSIENHAVGSAVVDKHGAEVIRILKQNVIHFEGTG